jgi:hypothetical protein
MMRRILALMTACLYLFTVSCGSSTKLISPSEIKGKKDHISAITLRTGEIIEFDSKGARLDQEKQEVHGVSKDGKDVTVAFADVISATVQTSSHTDAVVIAALTVAFLILVIASTNDDSSSSSTSSGSSCPYVYSFDGDHYVMDAEPLSGAITKGLERDDLCRLEHLEAHHGQYELLVRNELKETQYIDRLQLRVVDHAAGSTVCTDMNGGLHLFGDLVAPSSARDESGVDLRALLKSSDHIPWQSSMPGDESWRDVSLRNQLTFTFPKPHGAATANLVVDAATSQWGSVMMRQMMQARGNRLNDWYAAIDAHGPAMADLIRFNQREELYFLKLYVQEGDQWVLRGWIPGGAPSASELKAIALDLSGVGGDTVNIRVEPPRGYWSFDYVAMSYHELPTPHSRVLPVAQATTNDHADIAATIAGADANYYEMKHVGDAVRITFAAPAPPSAGVRSVFLDARGYYHAQIDETKPEETALIADVMAHDGAAVRYSLQRFAEMVTRSKATP